MFKESFKYYKSRNPPPKLSEVFDFDNIEKIQEKIREIDVKDDLEEGITYGLKSKKDWNVYELVDHPGYYFIKNPFTSVGQRYWTIRCIQDYSKKPNKCNLDSENLLHKDKNWWDLCQNNNGKLLLNKLRWVTLGYHHNWETKIYSEDSKGEFPKDLSDLSAYVTKCLGFNNFKAEAAIVNFYHMDSTLSGHTDYSEQDLNAPLISFSFGQTAIFLLGGKTKDVKPTAMFLRSGDIVIMAKESRLCYHGVPKILQMDSRFWDDFNDDNPLINQQFNDIINICIDKDLWKPFDDYLNNSRININVRQVLNRGQKRLCSESKENT